MTTAVVVQARVRSSRLPGKAMLPLGSHTVVEEVLRRCHAIENVDHVICAIPDALEDDALIPLVKRAGARLWRGPEADVLARYRGAAEDVGADVVMRVTSDCPLIDPSVCGRVLAARASESADYACNNMPPTFPHGLDCEAFTIEALRGADAEGKTAESREHVTPWLRQHADVRRANVIAPGISAADMRWTLDYPEDYEFFKRLFALLPSPPAVPAWRDVLTVLAANPDIAAINAGRHVTR